MRELFGGVFMSFNDDTKPKTPLFEGYFNQLKMLNSKITRIIQIIYLHLTY